MTKKEAMETLDNMSAIFDKFLCSLAKVKSVKTITRTNNTHAQTICKHK